MITELPIGKSPKPIYFARRNRIISGLCQCIVLVEAGIKSGALSAIRYARSQGKIIFAVSGMPIDKRFAGCNLTLKKGAYLLESADDIKNFLKGKTKNFDYQHMVQKSIYDNVEIIENYSYQSLEVESAKAAILNKIDYYPIDLQLLKENLQIPHSLMLSALIELEIEEKVTREEGDKVSLRYCGKMCI